MTELTVIYTAMPESNGKTNWTAMLCRKDDLWGGITIDRSEYPDRVRYEADRVRYLIGELTEEPDILAYDPDLHSGYVSPEPETYVEVVSEYGDPQAFGERGLKIVGDIQNLPYGTKFYRRYHG